MRVKEVVVLAIVVSFITSLIVGAIAGGLSGELVSGIKGFPEGREKSELQGEDGIIRVVGQEEAVVSVVEKVSPAVVSVIVTKNISASQTNNPFGDDEFFRRFFGDDFMLPFGFQSPDSQGETENVEVAGGTGFIVSSDGMILTNKHLVLDEEAEYTVLTNNNERIPAEVLALDPVQDIAILKIERGGLPVVELSHSGSIKIGQTVVAIGNALGEFRNTVSVGVVSGLQRSIVTQGTFGQLEQLSEVIQTDAAINQGNSGGPLLNLAGQAIGINVAMAVGAENIGFSLPIEKAKRDIEQVEKKGKISYPFLGVRYILINPRIQEINDLSVDYGALIIRGDQPEELAVVPGSPADKAGLVENDIILEINGEKITSENHLALIINKYEIGERISLKILHRGDEKTVEAKLEERN